MRFERLDLNLLVALDALLEAQNVSAAAERVCLSQSAMSGALSRLREYFQDELLISVGRRMVLTPRAVELAEPVRSALLIIKTTIATKPEFDPATSQRHFRIICSDYIVDVLLADLLRELSVEAPGLTFDILMPHNEMFSLIERGDADLIITLEQYISEQPSALLFEDDHVVLACASNARLQGGLTTEAFFELPHVIARFGQSRSPAFVESFFEGQALKRNIELAVPAFSMVPGLLIGTDRVATMLRRHAEHFTRHLPVKLHPLPVPAPNVREMAQWHSIKRHDRALAWLVERLRRNVKDRKERLAA